MINLTLDRQKIRFRETERDFLKEHSEKDKYEANVWA
jgi:hypothetical protein